MTEVKREKDFPEENPDPLEAHLSDGAEEPEDENLNNEDIPDGAESEDGQKKVLVPVVTSMTKYLFKNYRLATPLYWQQMNGIMKNAIDRMFALAGKTRPGIDTALIVSGGTPEGPIYDRIEDYFRGAFAGPEVLNWNVVDVIKAGGLNGIGDAKKSPYYKKTYQLGKKLTED